MPDQRPAIRIQQHRIFAQPRLAGRIVGDSAERLQTLLQRVSGGGRRRPGKGVGTRRRALAARGNGAAARIPPLASDRGAPESLHGGSFCEGETAMKKAIMATLYCRSGHIDALTPSDNFFWQVGQSFSAKYIAERVKRSITTRNLWERPLKPEIMTRTYKGLSKIRLMPRVMRGRFRTTVFLYDDSVMYVSSKKSGYVLIVKSKEHFETVMAMYDGIWEHSKEVGKLIK